MRLTVLACWAMVAALVVAVEAKPYAPPTFDIAAAYEAYHQLWMSEAQRNAVRPLPISQQVARSWPGKQSVVRKVAPSAPVEEKPPQEQLTAGPETEKAMVDQKTQEPQEPQEQMTTAQQTETQTATEQQTPEMTTDEQTQDTMTVEATTTEQPVQEEVTTEMQTQEQTTPQTSTQASADMRSAKKEASPQQQAAAPTARPHMKAAFDNFFNRWNAERIRNSIPPVATPIPQLSTSYYDTKQTKLTKQPVASKTVDPPVETPANAPVPKASVDTLTQKAAPSAPAAATIASPALSTALSLAQPANWGQQGSSPLIIILQQPGAAAPMLG